MRCRLFVTLGGGDELGVKGSGGKLPAELGEVIGGYELKSVISHGGMGCVYHASHARLGRPAAVKVLAKHLVADEEFVGRLYREAQIVNDVRHPNIVDIFDFVETEDPKRIACVMEYISGPTLKAVVRRQRLRLEQAINLTRQLGSALEEIHKVGVIHRDLKPTNVIVTGNIRGDLAEVPSVKLLDFGIAKLESPGDHLTSTGTMLGTPAYMAPEQVAADTVTFAADVYALGEIFYEMISGRRAYVGTRTDVLKHKVMGATPPLPLPDQIPAADQIRALVASSLTHKAEQRPTLEAFLASVAEIAAFSLEDAGMEILDAATFPVGSAGMLGSAKLPDRSVSNKPTSVDIQLDLGGAEFPTTESPALGLDVIRGDAEKSGLISLPKTPDLFAAPFGDSIPTFEDLKPTKPFSDLKAPTPGIPGPDDAPTRVPLPRPVSSTETNHQGSLLSTGISLPKLAAYGGIGLLLVGLGLAVGRVWFIPDSPVVAARPAPVQVVVEVPPPTPAEAKPVSVASETKTPVAKTKQVTLVSEPRGARAIDLASGRLLGKTPIGVQVDEGASRKVRLEMVGYRGVDVVVNSGQTEARRKLVKIARTTRVRSKAKRKTLPKRKKSSPIAAPKKKPAPVKANEVYSDDF